MMFEIVLAAAIAVTNHVGRVVSGVEKCLVRRAKLVVNRDKTKVMDMRANKAALGFLGYEFRFVKSKYDEGRYLTFLRAYGIDPTTVVLVQHRARILRTILQHQSLPVGREVGLVGDEIVLAHSQMRGDF